MEKLLIKSRIDCPPPEPRQLLKEKDLIIQKQHEKLKIYENNFKIVLKERDFLLDLIHKLFLNLNLMKPELTNRLEPIDTNNNNILSEAYLCFIKDTLEQAGLIVHTDKKQDVSSITPTISTSSSCSTSSLKEDVDEEEHDDYGSTEQSEESAPGHPIEQLRSERAARIIQNAYRQYRLKKNYIKLYENSLKRRSSVVDAVEAKTYQASNNIDLPSVDFEHLIEFDQTYDLDLNLNLISQNSKDNEYEEEDEEEEDIDEEHPHTDDLDSDLSVLSLIDNGRLINFNQNKSVDVTSDDEDTKSVKLNEKYCKNTIQAEVRNQPVTKQSATRSQPIQSNQKFNYQQQIKSSCSSSVSTSATSLYLSSSSSSSSASSTTSSTSNPLILTPNKKIISPVKLEKSPKQIMSPNRSVSSSATSTPTMNSNVKHRDYDLSKHKYLVGLNLFNRKPEKGINYLVDEKFLDRNPRTIAEFLFNRNCISKQMIGEYISNTQDKFIRVILSEFIRLIDLRNMPVDEALRKFQSHFRMPGEAQKIEHLTHSFAIRYIECNKLECKNMFNCADETIEVLAYAIILLNTSIHNPNVKANEKMKFEQFLKMTKGIDNGNDIDKEYLQSIYDRVKQNEFKPGKDHTSSVIEFEKNLVGPKKPAGLFALPHRRLVCIVQLYEIFDITKKEKANSHQRDCFLFNDILVITKVFSKKKNNTLYTYRNGFPLHGMNVVLFMTNHYQFGIRLIRMPEKKVLITFNARNENDQQLFCRDLAESIAESNELELIRVKSETEKQLKLQLNNTTNNVSNGNVISSFNGNIGNTNISNCNDNNGMSTVINSCTNVTPNNKNTSLSTSSSASSASSSINASNTISTISATSSSTSSSSSGGILTNNLSSTKIKRLVFSGTNQTKKPNNQKSFGNSQQQLLKRTLSNSLLDLSFQPQVQQYNHNQGSSQPNRSAQKQTQQQIFNNKNANKFSMIKPNLQRSGSDCSIFNNVSNISTNTNCSSFNNSNNNSNSSSNSNNSNNLSMGLIFNHAQEKQKPSVDHLTCTNMYSLSSTCLPISSDYYKYSGGPSNSLKNHQNYNNLIINNSSSANHSKTRSIKNQNKSSSSIFGFTSLYGSIIGATK